MISKGFISFVLGFLLLATAEASTVRVHIANCSQSASCLVDASTVVQDYVLDAGLGTLGDHNTSYALSDTARFSRASWDDGAWDAQGAVITEKLLSLGTAEHFRLVRRWLLNTPVLPSGEVFATEGGQFHTGNDGKWEANAEFIMSAALFAKHVGQDNLFHGVAQRLICVIHTHGTRKLVISSDHIDDKVCLMPAPSIEHEYADTFATTLNGAYFAHTEGATMNSSGTVLFQNFISHEPFSAVSIPLREYKSISTWAVTALVYDSQRKLFHSQDIQLTQPEWVDLRFSKDAPAGEYLLELWPSSRGQVHSQNQKLFTSVAWISTLERAELANGSIGGTSTFQPGTVVGSDTTPVAQTVGERLAVAMQWQLSYTRKSSTRAPGVVTIPQAHWRGTAGNDVGAAGGMFDLIRSGYQDAYLNLRMIESLGMMLELQVAGLVKPVVTLTDLGAAKSSFVSTFSTKHGFLSWVGCNHVIDDQSECEGAANEQYLIPVDIGFVPTLALAAKLDVREEGKYAALTHFDEKRDAARNESGRFRTNLIPIENINVSLWRASSKWQHKDKDGFARRSVDTGGDWHIFGKNDRQDGYGQWGLTEENGGILVSTTALVFSAGVYKEMFVDFASLVDILSSASKQLGQGVAGTRKPLLHNNRSYLRLPITSNLPKKLCNIARKLNVTGENRDRWGEHWCDYYKSVSWNLPDAGGFVYAFAKGLLSLELPIVGHASVLRSVIVWGNHVQADVGSVQIHLPQWAMQRWPEDLLNSSIAVLGMNIAGVASDLTCEASHLVGDQVLQLHCRLDTSIFGTAFV